MPLQTGEILRNRYRIEDVLGQGGMGAVYKSFDINLGVAVAVKENLFTTDEYARQFRREATILASLRHPNLPRVTDHFVIEGQGQYLVMDFIQGEDLRERLEREGAVSEEEALPWFLEICDALAYLHTRMPPILHRDIKPGNIKIMPDGRAMLVDFGLAKVVDESGTTTTGAKAMTPGFSPPEQYGTGRTDARTDVYSLGATMYAALTATIPEDALERAMGREELTPIRKRSPKISPSLARVIEKALAVRSENRYQSMAEFASAMAASSRSTRPTLISNYPHLERTIRSPQKTLVGSLASRVGAGTPGKRRRWPLVLVSVMAVLLVLAGALYALPDLPDQLGSLFSPAATVPGEAVSVGSTESTELTATATLAVRFPTITPNEPESASTEDQNGPPLGEPTITNTPAPTPIGGGIGQVAFASERNGVPQIFLINVDGTGVIQLTNLPDGACQPSWSPDGSELVFTSPCLGHQESYPGASLWILDVVNQEPRPLDTAPGGDYDPSWSPAGDKIVFTSEREGRPQIYWMNTDGTGVENISEIFAREINPEWSPAVNQIMFVTYRNGYPQIWVMPVSGGEASRFSRSERDDSQPEWSPDGQLVVFERQIGGIPRLVAARYEDRGARDFRVCQQGSIAAQPMAEPSFSPDGRWIAFETWPDGTNHNIAVLTTSCTNYTELTTDPALDFDAAWRP